MPDKPEPDAKRTDQPQPPIRRPWHAPQFILTELALTDAQGNAGNDGGSMGSAS